MHWVIDRLPAPKSPRVLTNDLSLLPAFQPVRIGTYLHGTTNRTGIHGVAVIIKPNETGF